MSADYFDGDTLQTEEDKQKVLDAMKICSDSMLRIDSEKSLIGETLKKLSKEVGVSKKVLSKMVKVYYKKNYDEEVAQQEQFEKLYTTVVK